ncbi:MAG TPA: pteridine reductase [Gammaproteobacteria bacterium]|nr:pteridine reductase [Gammaproteobacteria bacterium]
MSVSPKAVLITGAARRIGKAIAELLHAKGMQIIIHYHSSAFDAENLCAEFNQQRPNSAAVVQANLNRFQDLSRLIDEATNAFGYLDVLVNNASGFSPTPIGAVNEAEWTQLMDANLKAPFFLSQYAAPKLRQRKGTIINLCDIHAERPLKNYPVYCMSKAGLMMMTYALAKELAPDIRVNAVSPGAILWPEDENELNVKIKSEILSRIALGQAGSPIEIAKAVLFFIEAADYVTGQVLAVDGGRLLNC